MSGYILGSAPTAEFRLQLLDELTAAPFVEAMKKHLPKHNMRICVLGCGSAHLEARLATIFSSCHFIGIDISKARLREAEERVKKLDTTNTYEFIEADITTMALESFAMCDILISRFVLSHLHDPEKVVDRFITKIRPGGYICIEEGASHGREYYSNTFDTGYELFVAAVGEQQRVQKSQFDIAFRLFSKPLGNLLHYHITQPILANARDKSILRLGVEEGREILPDKGERLITALKAFEQDESSYGLYGRFLAFIRQT